jgi:8-oxo-dGTP pyrophosphatase MutT (NUDIX family)
MSSKKNYDLTINDIENIFQDRAVGAEGKYNFFSVLVPIVEKKDGLYILYEVRARHMVRQPGEICFPGGEMEPGEDEKQCAVRETREEIGIPEDRIRVVAQLDTLYSHSNFTMYAYLGIIEEEALEDMKLNPDEVDEVFLVPLEELLDAEPEVYDLDVVPQVADDFPYDKVSGGQTYRWRKGKATVPIYEVSDRVIWGLTGRITKGFIEAIKAEEEEDV